ncbi:MAG: hypothetical protein R2834_18175 [Rhodothermales bacterium]
MAQRILIAIILGWALPAAAQPSDANLLQSFRWRNIGPANIGGRVVDIEAAEADFATVYLASASGGVWKSENAGTTWTPIFDHYGSASIGDIGLFQPDPNILWVGTGEANNRNSVSWGDGVYRSTDGGATFTHIGLAETDHIARILTHPADPDLAYVCATGPLWGYTGRRGLFKTSDAGAIWIPLTDGLPDDGRTGCTDAVMDPSDPDILYAAFYERLRRPWHFHSGGPNGGIFKSTDGGVTWKKLTRGLPAGDTGRIGLAIYRADPDILMAIVEAEKSDDLDLPGSGIYKSTDAGETWTYLNTYNHRPFYYSQIRINPQDDRRVYVLTTNFMVSDDGGVTFRNGSEDQEVHGDFHALWLDPSNPDRYYLGADKGASLTHDHGRHFQLFDNLPIGQYYRIGVDMRDPYYVYGGLQDNGAFATPSFAREARGILNDHSWKLHWGDGQDVQVDPTDWRTVYTSMENGATFRYDALTHEMTAIRPTAAHIVNYAASIPEDERERGLEFRFNWSAPLVMSPLDPRTLYAGAERVFMTSDGGETWRIISPDLTTNHPVKSARGRSGGLTPDNTGAEHHGTITTIAPSPVSPSVLWAGTDDGNVQVTRDGGAAWTNVRANLSGVPDSVWVSRIEASHFDAGTAYLAFDGHRSDLFEPWIFKTTDYGATWENIAANIPPHHVVRVVREDLHNPKLLFAGTEFGVFASLNGGARWTALENGLPTVATLDLVIHPRDNDLVAGTHGRSLWILDDISPLQQLNDVILASDAHLFEQPPATIWENTSRGGQRGHFWWAGENPPEIVNMSSLPRAGFRSAAIISYFIGRPMESPVSLEIVDPRTGNSHRATLEGRPGIHRYRWDLAFDPEWLTDEERETAERAFSQMLSETDHEQLRGAYDRFRRADSPRAQRQALQILRSGFFDAGLGEAFDLPTAGPGEYQLRLRIDRSVWESRLVVRADPLSDAGR